MAITVIVSLGTVGVVDAVPGEGVVGAGIHVRDQGGGGLEQSTTKK